MPPVVQRVLIPVGLVALTLATYGPLWNNDFINLDDETWITRNPHVRAGLTPHDVEWAWDGFHEANWVPLTWMSLQLDASLSPGRVTGGEHTPSAVVCHAQNLFWHTATVVLLFFTLRRMTGAVWCSAFAAALFAVHPLHVESVAWATERKDVLSTFFLVLAMLAYSGYTERPGLGRYVLVLSCFVLGLLAKPMLVTLPFCLLLLDWWPLRRLERGADKAQRIEQGKGKGGGAAAKRRKATSGASGQPSAPVRGPSWLLVEKVPLFAVAVAAGVVTVLAQRSGGATQSTTGLSLTARLANAAAAYGWYLEKTVWPSGLAPFYPHPHEHWRWGPVLVGGVVLLAVTVTSLAGARRWPWLTVGWLWFLGTLVPVIGLVQVGDQARADRYSYVPHIGLFIALVWSAAAVLDRLRVPAALRAAAAGCCLVPLSVLTWVQVDYWQDAGTVWEHALAVTSGNDRAHFNLANYLADRGWAERNPALLAGAREHYAAAVALEPGDFRYRYNYGTLLLNRGELDQAREQFERFVELNPAEENAWYNLGLTQLRTGQPARAVQSLRRALTLKPGSADTLKLLREALGRLGR
jgi:hypothetical protein